MILNNYRSGDRILTLRLVEPQISKIATNGNNVTYTAEYVVNRHCVLVGYANKKEAKNIFSLISGLPNLDFSALLEQYGVIKKLQREYLETVTVDEETGEEVKTVNATREQIEDELKNTVCVIIE